MKPRLIEWAGATQKQRIERWQNVLRVLRALTPHERKNHWDMGHWGAVTECGTVACAGGHCGLDPWFERRGFAMIQEVWGFNGWVHFTPRDFFGPTGTARIFNDITPRPVGDVIREVRDYIKQLKAAPESPDPPHYPEECE